MAKVMDFVPEAEGDEAIYLNKMFSEMSDEDISKFSKAYKARRKDSQTVLLLCLIGFFGAAGVHRVILNQVGMGLLYFFTGGLCLIGTIVDLVNHKDLTFQYNRSLAMEIKAMI